MPFHSDCALVHELDESGWVKVLDAGSALLALELRQLGGAFAVPAASGGALDRFAAPLHYYGVGMAAEATEHDLEAVRPAIQPYLTGFTAPNFVDHFQQPQRTHDDETRVRVERVRRVVAPTGLFAGDVEAVV